MAWRWAAAAASPQDIIAAADGLFHLHDIRSWFSQGEAEFAAAVSALSVRTTNPTVTTALGKVMSCQAWFLFHLGHTQRAIALFNTALDMLRSANASVEMMFPLSYLGAVYVHLGDLVRGAQICSEGSRLARELENQYYQAIACNILGQAAYEQGDYPTARRWSEESLSIERALNNKWSMAFSLINLGKVALALGDFGRAEHLFYESLAIRDLLEDHRGSAICLSYLGNTALASGSLATAVVHFTNGLAFSESAGSPWCVANALFNLAKLDAIEGTQLAKLRILQTGLDIAVYIQAAPLIATGLSLLAQCAAPILPKHWGHTALAADMGAQCNIAEQFLVWANAQSSLVDMTLNSAIDLVVTHAHAARQHLVDRPMSWAQSHELTPREIEVLQLIMHGLADAQIAEQLVISRRTVSTHLTSIYSKLNVKSRTAAALLAMAADPLLIVSNSTSATT